MTRPANHPGSVPLESVKVGAYLYFAGRPEWGIYQRVGGPALRKYPIGVPAVSVKTGHVSSDFTAEAPVYVAEGVESYDKARARAWESLTRLPEPGQRFRYNADGRGGWVREYQAVRLDPNLFQGDATPEPGEHVYAIHEKSGPVTRFCSAERWAELAQRGRVEVIR